MLLNYFSFDESNTDLSSSLCYNWSQTNNGQVFVATEEGIFRFDGKNMKLYKTKGKGRAISSSLSSPSGRLWCNSFYGDIYYKEKERFVRHSISNQIRELTTFHRLGERFYLRTENLIYEVHDDVKNIQLLDSFPQIRTLFTFKEDPYALCANEVGAMLVNLRTNERRMIAASFSKDSHCRLLEGKGKKFLFFVDTRTLISLENFMFNNLSKAVQLEDIGKVNYAALVDEYMVVCGGDGIHFFDLNGKYIKHLLSGIRVTHFGKDNEGNYLATTSDRGLLVIPSLTTFQFSYRKWLESERIIRTIEWGQSLIHGTDSGKLLRHDLSTNAVDLLVLNGASDVLSLTVSNDRLFAYCEALNEIDLKIFKIKRKSDVSSAKNMMALDDIIYIGSRKGIIEFEDGKYENKDDIGWNLGMLHIPQLNALLFSTKNGFFLYDLALKTSRKIYWKQIEAGHNIQDLRMNENMIYFLYDEKEIFKTDINFSDLSSIYKNQKKSINGLNVVEGKLFISLKDSVCELSNDGKWIKKFSRFNGLNESKTNNVFKYHNDFIFCHPQSLSIFKNLPKTNLTVPDLDYLLLSPATFTKEGDFLVSEYQDNSLQIQLMIGSGIRSRGGLQVYYHLAGGETDWIELENPYGELSLDRLPIGKGNVLIKAVNEDGGQSNVLKIPYNVVPPFYFTYWFLVFCGLIAFLFVVLIVRWRVSIARKKALDRMKKQKLETRALHAELTAIRSQMNPHFIFNVLTAIQAKVIQGHSAEAYQNIGDFADLIRNVLEKSGEEYIFLEEEIELMKNYVELENSRMDTPFSFTVDLDDSEFFEGVLIPTLITQPLIENSIRHAFPVGMKDRQIQLKARRTPVGFELEVADNGTGIDSTSKKSRNHVAFALPALEKRIEVISKGASSPYRITLRIDSDSNGTRVQFNFEFRD